MKKDYTVALYNKDYDNIKELVARGKMRRYFGGNLKWSERESFGILFGAFLCFAFSYLIPVFLGKSGLDPDGIQWTSRFLIAGGIVVLIKGFYDIRKDAKKVRDPVTDDECDECFRNDMAGIIIKARKVLSENIPALKEGYEDIESLELHVVTGPEDRSANVNLPLLMVVGENGIIRCSNYSVLVIAFGKEDLYIYQCVYNMRDGSVRREHAYRCPNDIFRNAEIRRDEKNVLTGSSKPKLHKLLEFVISTDNAEAVGEGEAELAITVADLTCEERSGGRFSLKSAEEAVEKLMKIRGCSPVPRRSAEIVGNSPEDRNN